MNGMELAIKIAEIRARCAKATPAPWTYDERVGCIAVYSGEKVNCFDNEDIHERALFYKSGYQKKEPGCSIRWETKPQDQHDGRFIAHAREDVIFLLEELYAANARERHLALQNVNDTMSYDSTIIAMARVVDQITQEKNEQIRLLHDERYFVNWNAEQALLSCEKAATAEKELAVYKKHIRENTISCTTCARDPDLCHGCTNFNQGTDVLLWEPEVPNG